MKTDTEARFFAGRVEAFTDMLAGTVLRRILRKGFPDGAAQGSKIVAPEECI